MLRGRLFGQAMSKGELNSLMKKAVRDFEKEFKVKLQPTGYSDSGTGYVEKEYFLEGLVSSKQLNLMIRGTISVGSDRAGDAYFFLFLDEINMCPDKAFRAIYVEEGWSQLRWEEFTI